MQLFFFFTLCVGASLWIVCVWVCEKNPIVSQSVASYMICSLHLRFNDANFVISLWHNFFWFQLQLDCRFNQLWQPLFKLSHIVIWLFVCLLTHKMSSQILSTSLVFWACVSVCVRAHAIVCKRMHRHACQECSLKLYGSWCCAPAPLLPFPEFSTSCQVVRRANTCSPASVTANKLGLKS